MSKRSQRRARKASAAQERAARGGGRVLPPSAMQYSQAPPPPADQTQGWFGPGDPPAPGAPSDVAGRRYDYPVGINMLQQPRSYEPVGFAELRALADGYDVMRLIIERRKDQLARLKFAFTPRDSKQKMRDGDELSARASKYDDLFRRPDRENFWADWLRNVLEDLLVIDAPTVHVRRTLGGEVYSLDQLDGATIKRVIDDWGRTPQPPFAAYQQVLKGLPAVNYSRQDLVYRPRNLRVHKTYGFSPVEQVIMTVNIALRRQMWQLAYFTDGNIPDSLIGVPSTWTPDQIRQFQDWFDALLQGNTGLRRTARFVPGEVAKSYVPTKEAEIFGAAEEWLARVVCFCFGVSHQPFVKEVNRATADTAMESAMQDGLAPIMNWVKGLVDSILIDQFQETELEFCWLDDKELDPKTQSEIHDKQNGKVKTVNEVRGELGLDPDPSPEANMLGTWSATGFVPLNTDLAIQLKKKMSDAFPQPTMSPDGEEDGLPPGESVSQEGAEEGTDQGESVEGFKLRKYSEDQERADDGKLGSGPGDSDGGDDDEGSSESDDDEGSGDRDWSDSHAEVEYSEELTDDDLAALDMYTGDMSEDVNRYLDGKMDDKNGELEQLATELDAAIDKSTLKDDAAVYRGVSNVDRLIEGKEVGDEITFSGFMSTTTELKVAETFMERKSSDKAGIAEIRMSAGQTLLDVTSATGINFLNESEAILPRGSTFVYGGRDEKTGHIILTRKG